MTSTTQLPTAPQLAYAVFDVELDGGGRGSHPMRGDTVPAGAIVVDALVRIDRQFVTVGRDLTQRQTPTLALFVGEGRLTRPATLSYAGWPAGRVQRASLSAEGRVLVASAEQPAPLTVGIETGGQGFTAGALTAVITYVEVP